MGLHPCQGPGCDKTVKGAEGPTPGQLTLNCSYLSEAVCGDKWPKHFCSRRCIGQWAAQQTVEWEAWLERERQRAEEVA